MISPPQSELYIISGNRSAKHLDHIGLGASGHQFQSLDSREKKKERKKNEFNNDRMEVNFDATWTRI